MGTLLYFSATYCGHCKRFDGAWAQTLSMLDAFRVPVRTRKLVCDRVESDRREGEAYGVRGFPTILLQVGGQVFRYGGTREPRDLFNWVTSIVGFGG